MSLCTLGQLSQPISVFWDHQKMYWSLRVDVPEQTIGDLKVAQCRRSDFADGAIAHYLNASAVSSSYKIVAGIFLETILSNSVSSPCSAFSGALRPRQCREREAYACTENRQAWGQIP